MGAVNQEEKSNDYAEMLKLIESVKERGFTEENGFVIKPTVATNPSRADFIQSCDTVLDRLENAREVITELKKVYEPFVAVDTYLLLMVKLFRDLSDSLTGVLSKTTLFDAEHIEDNPIMKNAITVGSDKGNNKLHR